MIKQVIRRILVAAGVFSLVAVGSVATVTLQSADVYADDKNKKSGCQSSLLTFPAWYKGLTHDNCDLKAPGYDIELDKFIIIIAMNVLDILLQIVGYVAIAFLFVGGFRFMTQGGSPDGIVAARRTIQNAVIGLVIAIAAVAIVKFIAGVIA